MNKLDNDFQPRKILFHKKWSHMDCYIYSLSNHMHDHLDIHHLPNNQPGSNQLWCQLDYQDDLMDNGIQRYDRLPNIEQDFRIFSMHMDRHIFHFYMQDYQHNQDSCYIHLVYDIHRRRDLRLYFLDKYI